MGRNVNANRPTPQFDGRRAVLLPVFGRNADDQVPLADGFGRLVLAMATLVRVHFPIWKYRVQELDPRTRPTSTLS